MRMNYVEEKKRLVLRIIPMTAARPASALDSDSKKAPIAVLW